ncbi:dynein heavy chain, region 1, partial [Ostertagia ostertagi]
ASSFFLVERLHEPRTVLLLYNFTRWGEKFLKVLPKFSLKQTLALVTDYNSLMKDFPLNELVSASDLDSIKIALGNVFGHMKKIRATKYPVLGTRRLMHISIVEFDQLMMQCIQLFNKWDDEYDRFIALLRDISKKKRDEPVKLMWKVLPLHKKLEGRLVQIKAFRKFVLQIAVFVIDRRSKDGKPHLHLKVNFSPESIVLHKEVRNLKNMGFRIPLKVVNAAHQANQIYPFAISLLESTRTYESINERLAQKTGIDTLIASYKKDIQSQIADGYQLNWESYKIDPYVTKLADTVNNYQERVEDLILIADNIEVDLAALDTCQYNAVTIGAQLASIQKSVDQLALGNYSNLTQWVDKLDKK